MPLQEWTEVPDPGPPSTISVSEPCAAHKTRRHQGQPEEFCGLRPSQFVRQRRFPQEPGCPPYCRQTGGNLQGLHILLHIFTVTESNYRKYNNLHSYVSDLKSAGPKRPVGFKSPSRHQNISGSRAAIGDFGCRYPQHSRLQSACSESSNKVRSGWNRSIEISGENQRSIRAIREQVDKNAWAFKEILPG